MQSSRFSDLNHTKTNENYEAIINSGYHHNISRQCPNNSCHYTSKNRSCLSRLQKTGCRRMWRAVGRSSGQRAIIDSTSSCTRQWSA